MPKKPKDTNTLFSLEDDFLKVMEGGDNLDHFFQGTLDSVEEAKPEAAPRAPEKSHEEIAGLNAAVSEKAPGRDAFSEYGLELKISPDNMLAHLIGQKAHAFTSENLVKALEKKGIIQGINYDAIVQITSILKNEGSWTGKIIIARGIQPMDQEKISYPFIAKDEASDEENCWLVDRKKMCFHGLINLFEGEDLPTEEEVAKVVVRPVDPGDVLAIVEARQDPAPGFDIFGRPIPVGKPMLVPGKKVKRNEQNGNYEAMTFGYLCIDGNVLSIISPVLIAPDHMTAYFVNCPHRGAPKLPSLTSVKYSLIMKGIDERRISESIIEMLCTGLKQNKVMKPLIKIASGIPPVDGKDAKFVFSVDLEKRAGTVKDDDTIDLKERNVIRSVEKGDLLATKYLASRGRPGITLFNKKLKQQAGNDVEMIFRGLVTRKKYEDRIEYYAKVAGNVTVNKNLITLTDVYRVNGNVDYATGNINVATGLIVSESVKPGFKVSAGGDTTIGGTIENGAHILVRGNLSVAKGIMGKDTKVIVLGSLHAEFVQDAEIMVKGDVEISSYSFNATIRSGGEVLVKKSAAQRGGKVVGGIICATKSVTLSTLGGPANKNTTVAIQRDVELLGALKKIQSESQNCTSTIMKIMKSLQLEAVDANLIKAIIEKTPVDKRPMLIKLVENLNKLVKMRSELFEKEKLIEKKIIKTLNNAQIRVKTEAFLGNKVQIGDQLLELPTDMGTTVFALQRDKIVY